MKTRSMEVTAFDQVWIVSNEAGGTFKFFRSIRKFDLIHFF